MMQTDNSNPDTATILSSQAACASAALLAMGTRRRHRGGRPWRLRAAAAGARIQIADKTQSSSPPTTRTRAPAHAGK